jgi:hypothetical protein
MAIAKYSLTALDCPDPELLADFYSKISGFTVVVSFRLPNGDAFWVELIEAGVTRIAFQRIENYLRPTWPNGPTPQQFHLDFDVLDLDSAETEILKIGATKSEVQTSIDPQNNFRVYFDPVGHPFCLVRQDSI